MLTSGEEEEKKLNFEFFRESTSQGTPNATQHQNNSDSLFKNSLETKQNPQEQTPSKTSNESSLNSNQLQKKLKEKHKNKRSIAASSLGQPELIEELKRKLKEQKQVHQVDEIQKQKNRQYFIESSKLFFTRLKAYNLTAKTRCHYCLIPGEKSSTYMAQISKTAQKFTIK